MFFYPNIKSTNCRKYKVGVFVKDDTAFFEKSILVYKKISACKDMKNLLK